MSIKSFYPVLQVENPPGVADFFTNHFGFQVAFTTDWYVSLRNGAHELAVLDCTHPTIPEGFRLPCHGVLLNIEVDDAASEYTRLRKAGVSMKLELRDEAFGQRHFIVEAPGQILVDVIEEIPPAAEFADAFIASA
ncbi:glyoxalase [Arthrobacter sp. BL-252-APC-1A]|uniref:VOC family protein n=1 Tax=Arthrobacter sp. BL-252-APC-1A TaxID=2606622 RepID=UPI0012B34705|nr:VOC family protein [Arthrobacter sp. BL-252-APC-1A]MSR99612.1 glyoxalase [Arthrobacter sp. BL-252-APC-1A]